MFVCRISPTMMWPHKDHCFGCWQCSSTVGLCDITALFVVLLLANIHLMNLIRLKAPYNFIHKKKYYTESDDVFGGIGRKGHFAMFCFVFCVCKKWIPPLGPFAKYFFSHTVCHSTEAYYCHLKKKSFSLIENISV